jgi:NAD-dependent deacetylase
MTKIEKLKKWVAESKRIVAFTGAGVSTESGIKDFRSADGLYSETWRPNLQSSTE